MPQRNSQPLPWTPHGCSDTIDSSRVFEGAMGALTNLIPDPTTPDMWMCRPAAVRLTTFPTFNTPTFISAAKIVGNLLIGLMRTNRFVGFDEPFAWNLLTNANVPVSGVTALNVPAQAPNAGAWTPPVIDVIGAKAIFCSPGFGATAFTFGVMDISNPGAPAWSGGNTTGAVIFTTPPSYVAQFANRAYYIVNTAAAPALIFSDVLNPTNIFSAGQVITLGDNVSLTALGQLRLYNQLGGIIQALIIFKGVANCYQLTGDAALSTLALNSLNIATGTLSPVAIAATSKGLAFMSPDGVRFVDFQGNVTDAIGQDGKGISVPFMYAVQPSRIEMTCGGDILRVSVQNGNALNTPFQEWWYDMEREVWSGPHASAMSFLLPYNNTFIGQLQGVSGLWQSDVIQTNISSFVENGVQLAWTYLTALFPQTQQMAGVAVSQTLIDAAFLANTTYTATMITPDGKVLDTTTITLAGAVAIWGAFNWGAANWGAPGGALQPRIVPWHRPLVFAKAQFQLQGNSNSSVRLGLLQMRYKMLKYLTDVGAVA